MALASLNILFIVVIFMLAHLSETHKSKFLTGLHRWYIYGVVLFMYKQTYLMVRPIHPVDYDALFISIDRWLFGVNPTEWLAQFAHPFLTEMLQVAYSSYYWLFFIFGFEIYRRYPVEKFDAAAFMIVYGFYLSYLGYFTFPAVGPRFTLHSFQSLNTDLPGLLLTEPLRAFVNWGGSVPTNIPNPIGFVQRDVFPSGHTQLSLIVTLLAFRYKLYTRWFFLSLVTLLIIGTVYLRYHYVIDVIAGVFSFGFTIWSGDRIASWWNHWKNASAAIETQTKIT